MKKIWLQVLMIPFFVFSLAVPVQASWVDDDFDDNIMNPALWSSLLFENEDGGAKDQLTFREQNGRVEWLTGSAWTDSSDVSGGYASTWALGLDQDFEVTVDFHYDHTAFHEMDEGGVFLSFSDQSLSNYASISAKNFGLEGAKYQISGHGLPENRWERTFLSGQLAGTYDSTLDQLSLSASEGGSYVFSGFQSEGLAELHVGLVGWSGGAKLNGYDAYFDNFKVVQGNIVPEPASFLLFLVGGASLAAFRHRRNFQ